MSARMEGGLRLHLASHGLQHDRRGALCLGFASDHKSRPEFPRLTSGESGRARTLRFEGGPLGFRDCVAPRDRRPALAATCR